MSEGHVSQIVVSGFDKILKRQGDYSVTSDGITFVRLQRIGEGVQMSRCDELLDAAWDENVGVHYLVQTRECDWGD